MSLTRSLLVGGLAVLVAGMLAAGVWIGASTERRALDREGELFGSYLDSIVSDRVQSLANAALLSDADMVALDKLFHGTRLGERVVAFKLWSRDGRVLFSTDLGEIGARADPGPALDAAFLGETQSRMAARGDAPQLIEIYAPVRDPKTRSIVAVSQIDETADVLTNAVAKARAHTWMVLIAATIAMFLLLGALIGGVGKTIVTQQRDLRDKVSQLTILLAQNEHLHERVARAAERTTALNERFLHRIAADLHDGPSQGLSLALMRIQALAEACGACQSAIGKDRSVAEEFGVLQQWLKSALEDMRSIAKGLHLPDIDRLSFADIARRAVRDYERTSGETVELTIEDVPESAPLPVKIALFRLLQESLANGFRHGGAVSQRVRLYILDGYLQIEVRDSGAGFDPQAVHAEGHLGLEGMRERVEILGGTFVVSSAAGRGTMVRAALPLTSTVPAHE